MIRDDQGSRFGGICLEVPPAESIETALKLHKAGRWGEAASLCAQVLEADEANAMAWHLLGLLHHHRGDNDDAIKAIREAQRLGLDNLEGRSILGQALQAEGSVEEALEEFRKGILLQPDGGPARLNLANALRDLKRYEEAVTVYIEAIRLDAGLHEAYAALGQIYFWGSRIEEARALLNKAAELDPNQPFYWECLAELHGSVDQYDLAIRSWERVLALSPNNRAIPHLSIGWALQEECRLDEAEAHLRLAIEIEPFSAKAWLAYGVLQEERGEFVQAEASYRAAIKLQPEIAGPHARLASLLRDKLPDVDLNAVVALIENPASSPWTNARLLFSLGHIMDAKGDYPLAAECLREANTMNLAQTPAHRRFVPSDHVQFIDGIIHAFNKSFFEKVAPIGQTTRRPVFIIGLARSGTTLLEQILASHPEVLGAGELNVGRRLYESLPALLKSNSLELSEDLARFLDAKTIDKLADIYLQKLRSVAGDGPSRVIDKMPDNYMYLGLLIALFPNATVIHCRRDLRDVALSCWMADFHSIQWTNSPEDIRAKFLNYQRLMAHWKQTLPLTIHDVEYEDTVSDLEGVARRILTAMDLPWNPACLDFHRTNRPVRTASLSQVRQPLYKTSIARWKRYEAELPDLFAAVPVE